MCEVESSNLVAGDRALYGVWAAKSMGSGLFTLLVAI